MTSTSQMVSFMGCLQGCLLRRPQTAMRSSPAGSVGRGDLLAKGLVVRARSRSDASRRHTCDADERPMRVDRRTTRSLSLLLIASSVAACISSPVRSPSPTPEATLASAEPSASEIAVVSASPSASPSLSPSTQPPASVAPTLAPSTPPASSCATRTLASLTLAQRVGQLFNVGLDHDQVSAAARDAILANHFGSVWYRAKTSIGVAGVRAVADAAQALATKRATGGIRFFVAANQEGGLVQALNGPGFDVIPSAVDQGKLQPADLAARAVVWGQQLKAAGINLDFAPVADVVPKGTEAQNAPIGELRREFGSEPLAVAPHVVAFI